MIFPTLVLAASTLSLVPASVNITEGESFSLRVILNPRGVNNYTTKVQLQYPPDLLETKSFTLGNGWMALSQPGYDLTDNTNGLLIKTAGYPGGISKSITFGTIFFLAKKSGEGIIKVGEDSFVLDVANQNVLTTPLAQAPFTIKELPVPPPEEEVIPSEEEIVPKEEVIPPEEEVIPPEEEIVPPRPLFDILIEPAIEKFRKEPPTSILVVGFIIITIAAYIVYRKRKKKII